MEAARRDLDSKIFLKVKMEPLVIEGGGLDAEVSLLVRPTNRPLTSAAILIQSEHVPGGITEARGDLGQMSADGLRDLASSFDHGFQRGFRVVHHDVNQEAR